MTKQKSALPSIAVPPTKHATDALLKTANQDPVSVAWWAGIRQTVAKFIAEHVKPWRAVSDEQSKTSLSVSEQLKLFDELQRMGSETGHPRYGSYPEEPVRYRPYIDHLVRPRAKHDVEDADEASDQGNDQSA